MDNKKQKKERLDDAITNATKLAEIEELQKEVARIRIEHEDSRNQLKRAVADYHNLEKRVNDARAELARWDTAELLTKMLPVLDHLEQVVDLGRATLSEQSESKGWFKGVEMAVRQLQDILKSEGLEEVRASGQFDPNLHEAVDTAPGDDNIILKIVRKGYNLNGKVLRPAQVIVGRSASAETSADKEGENI